jgi:CHAD domain-containing protein
MGAKAGVRAGESVGKALAVFGSDIIAEARAALDTPGLSDAVVVHDFRKAMKRWRAFLRLLQPIVGPDARRLRIEARDLARQLAAARDVQSALDALSDLTRRDDENGTLSPRTLATIAERLQALRQNAEATALTEAMRIVMRTTLDEAESSLAQWPFGEARFSDVAESLARGYRAARRTIPAAWPEADSEELHELRGRVVVHRYQMELTVPLWPRLGKLWLGEAQRLRERLGTCQDLAVLANFAGPHQVLAHWRSRLAPMIAARQAVHAGAAKRIARRLFAEDPRAFRKRLVALGRASAKAGTAKADTKDR